MNELDFLSVLRKNNSYLSQQVIAHRTTDRTFRVRFIGFRTSAFSNQAFEDAGILCPPTIKFSRLARQASYFYGRAAVMLELISRGSEITDVPSNANNAPIFPNGFYGSISHTSNFAAAYVHPSRGTEQIGLDIERIINFDEALAVESVVLCKSEHSIIQNQANKYYPLLMTAVFSAKESFYKAVSASVFSKIDFSALRLTKIDLHKKILHFDIQNSEIISPHRVIHVSYSQPVRNHVLTLVAIHSSKK